MAPKASLIQLTALLLTIFVSSLPLSTEAQVRCEAVFSESSKISVYKESFSALDQLTVASDELIGILESKPQTLNVAILDLAMRELEFRAEKYFKTAGIEYRKVRSNAYVHGLRDARKHIQSYSEYYLTGTKSGDEVSRFLYGVNAHRDFKDAPLQVKFDLLHAIKNDDVGHFRGDKNLVVIGPDVLENDMLGLSATLRHEIQHAFEQKKIARGDMTLARIDLFAGNGGETAFYKQYLREDEVETHIRDIRALVHPQKTSKNAKLEQLFPSEKTLTAIKKEYTLTLVGKTKLLENLIGRAKIANNQIESMLYSEQDFVVHELQGGLVAEFALPVLEKSYSFASYSTATVNLIGVFKAPQISEKDLRRTIFKVLDWNNQRILQIEKELKDIKVAHGL